MHKLRLIISWAMVACPLWAWSMPANDNEDPDRDPQAAAATVADSSVYVQQAELRPYDRRIHRYRKYWTSLIPTSLVVQGAGNMGLLSAGIGWHYGGHRQWETELLFGYIPKYKSSRGKLTITLKENYTPWSISLRHNYEFEPLRCGIYVNTVAGHEFWQRQPHHYPDKYYDFLSTKLRWNIFVGQGIEKEISRDNRKWVKSVTFFYEVSTCDLYVRLMVLDRHVKLNDILGLSLGCRFLLQ